MVAGVEAGGALPGAPAVDAPLDKDLVCVEVGRTATVTLSIFWSDWSTALINAQQGQPVAQAQTGVGLAVKLAPLRFSHCSWPFTRQ